MAFHAQRSNTVCATQWPCRHVTPYVVRSCVLSKGDYNMPFPTSSDYVYFTRARRNATLNVVRPYLLPNGNVGMNRPMSFNRMCSPNAMMALHGRCCSSVCVFRRDDDMPQLMLYDRLCCPRAMMACKTRRRSTVCVSKGKRCHVMHDVISPCVLPNCVDGIPRPTSSDYVCCPRDMWHTTSNVVRPRVLPKGDDGMSRPTSSNRMCFPMAMM
ncbi:hypothetical protein EJD97_012821, partial [Solanum chilense]